MTKRIPKYFGGASMSGPSLGSSSKSMLQSQSAKALGLSSSLQQGLNLGVATLKNLSDAFYNTPQTSYVDSQDLSGILNVSGISSLDSLISQEDRLLLTLDKLGPGAVQGVGAIKYGKDTLKAMKNAKFKALAPQIAQIAGAAADMIGGFIPDRPEYAGDHGDLTQTLDTVYDTAANGLMATGTPWGLIAGGAMKVGGLVNKGIGHIGGGTDGMTGLDAALGSNFLGLTPFGLINGFGGKRADTFTKDTEAFNMSMGSYNGSEALADSAAHKSGKKYGLFSSGARHRANREIAQAKLLQNKIHDIVYDAQDERDIAANMSQLNTNNYTYTIGGLYDDPYALRAAKNGMKLELAREFLKKPAPVKEEVVVELELVSKHEDGGTIEIQPTYVKVFDLPAIEIDSFKKGGSINVIPDGALHAHKHHMEDAENLTKKGIPVVDNNGEQQAEVEKGEIIFRLEVTQKLEELLKKFYDEESSTKDKDELALEAGKLLVQEILYNTKDKTKELL